MKMTGYGIAVDVPEGWEGRIYKRPEGDPTLHVGSFALPVDDGDFGALATRSIRQDDAFVVLTEYDAALAGPGLFEAPGLQRNLRPSDFRANAVLRTRPGILGAQRFFTDAGRAFCLYVVVGARSRLDARGPVAAANRILATVEIGAAP